MVLVTLPAIDGLKPSWREASSNLGGTSWTYWRRVGLPVLSPSLLGGFLLLFANAFSAFATAYALGTGDANLVPIKISFFLQGDIAGVSAKPLRPGDVDDPLHDRLDGRLPPAAEEGRAMAQVSRSRTIGRPPRRSRVGPHRPRPSCSSPAVCSSSLPLLTMARFSFQNVPMVRCCAGRTCSTSGRFGSLTDAFKDPQFWPTLSLSLRAGGRHGAAHPGAAAADGAARPPEAAQGPPDRRVPHAAAVHGAADRARRRRGRVLPPERQVVPQQRLLASSPSTPCSPCRSPTASIDAGIRAIDVRTLIDASRSLGAGWGTTLRRVLLPNLRTAIVVRRRSSPPPSCSASSPSPTRC